MDNLLWTGELLISDGAHSVGLCCQIEHTHACPLKMLGADFGGKAWQSASHQEVVFDTSCGSRQSV